MGLQADIDWMEEELARHFELKIRGRLGENCDGPQQIRILNRIVTLTEEGLLYEADPRHVDLLSQSLGLTASNAVLTPGVKDPNPDYSAQKEDESQPPDSMVATVDGSPAYGKGRNPSPRTDDYQILSLKTHHPAHRGRHVSFDLRIEPHDVPAYSSIYGTHPRFLAATSQGWRGV